MVKLTIDNKEINCNENLTILECARENGINIPTLCYFKELNEIGACRICCVELEGVDRLVSSCNTKVQDGMVVYTNSPRVRESRRINLQLILSEHDSHCTTCKRNGNCSLQTLAEEFNMVEALYQPKLAKNKIGTMPLIRIDSKCIKCMRCIQVCEDIQGIGIWDLLGTGEHARVGIRPDVSLAKNCALCGQCITHCPVGALTERDDTAKVYDALADEKKITIIQVAPAVRSAWAEELGLSKEFATEKRLVAAIKALGFDYVFDTNFSADLTIMEESAELIERIKTGGTMPMFTSCCPGWVRFMKAYYPQFTNNLSTAKSPQQMFGALAKTYFAEKIGADPKNIFCISIMPCVAKKQEAAIPNLNDACQDPDVDVVLTTRELSRMLKADHIDVNKLDECEFDSPLGTGTGAAVIFGATGGVLEAALRTAYFTLTGSNPDADAFSFVRGEKGRRTAELDINGIKLSVAVTSGLKNSRELLDDIVNGKVHCDFVEIMACPGGCAGGGGQPIHDGIEPALGRGKILYDIDKQNKLRFSHENPDVNKMYEEFFEKPLSHKAHQLLHTDLNEWELF